MLSKDINSRSMPKPRKCEVCGKEVCMITQNFYMFANGRRMACSENCQYEGEELSKSGTI